MFDYLQKFNELPRELRDKVSSPEAMKSIIELEGIYQVDLAALVMKIMVGLVKVADLSNYFVEEFKLSQDRALSLKNDLLSKVLNSVSSHLKIVNGDDEPVLEDRVDKVIKDAGLVMPSEELLSRLKNILVTYFKGVRSKIDTKNSLLKKVEFGGLSLSEQEVENIFKTISGKKESLEKDEQNNKIGNEESRKKLDQIIMASESMNSFVIPKKDDALKVEKNILKQDDKIKEAKRIEAPEEIAELVAPEEEKLLEAPDEKNNNFDEKVVTEKKPIKKVVDEPKKTVVSGDNKKADNLDSKLLSDIKKAEDEIVAKIEKKNPVASTPKAPKSKIEEKASLDTLEEKEKKNEVASTPIISKSKIEEKPPLNISKEKEKKEEKKEEKNKEEERIIEDDIEPLPVNLNFKRPAHTREVKPRMDDIKAVPKIMSPVEELQFLNLTNFHRLSSDTNEIIEKIFAKIKLLERDGYDKMVQGVKAWRQSEVNRLYLKIGQEAIINGTNIRDAIVERQKKKLPYLSIEEIEAISNLNSRLAF